ncbi:beta-eliminating lyase-related protein [Telmatospirillum sp.]|uniref:threonine aldolase family protein n=1 Tax=Telmatospirillum sp. TaxID=2079197 RepID=UPI002847A9A0|nr:beta-eliminating lyase-related protein [Telmatospirillum sp.]MDR3439345.1 beta-eliminating lyase-related protein [Telmatospirillum sp.]
MIEQPHDDHFPRHLASDNFAGIHPLVLAHIAACNRGHAMAYGDDPITARVGQAFDQLFGTQVTSHLVFNGTAANVLALSAFARSFGSVVCSDFAHLINDESTAPERILGMRLIGLSSRNGKIDPSALIEELRRGHGVHHPTPVALSLTQPTEVGTVYSPDEIRNLADIAHAHGMGVHVDGARLGTAVASLGVSVPQMLVETGVDVVSFGGTKQGIMCGEAVIFLKPGLGADFPHWQKHGLQLASKMRFLAAQFEALLTDDLWVENGRHANAMARKLRDAVSGMPMVEIAFPVESNAVFARIPQDALDTLQRHTFFWPWNGLVRWMCAFDTTPEDIESFAAALATLARR